MSPSPSVGDDRDGRRRLVVLAGLVLMVVLAVASWLLIGDGDEAGGVEVRNRSDAATTGRETEIDAGPAHRSESLESGEKPDPIRAVAVKAEPEPAPAESEVPAPGDAGPAPALPDPSIPTVLVWVTDGNTKKPVSGAGVAQVAEPLAPFRPDLEISATTGPDGTVRLPDGQCYVVMPAEYAARFIDLRFAADGKNIFRSPSKTRNLTVEVHRAVAVDGRVIDEHGIPLPGIPVQAGAITRLDRGSGSVADRFATPACDAGRWTVSITNPGGEFAVAGIPAGQVFVEILDDRWFFQDPPPIRMQILAGQDSPRVQIELARVTIAAVVLRGVPTGAPLDIDLKLPSVPPGSKEPIPPEHLEGRRGQFKDLQRRVLRELASAGLPKEGTCFRAGILAARSSDASFRPSVTISLPGAPGLPIKVPVRTQTVEAFDPSQATVVDFSGVDLGTLVPVRLRFRNEKGGAADWVPPLRLTSGVLPRPYRLPDAAAAADAGVVTLHLPPGMWDLKPDESASWREPWSFNPLRLHVTGQDLKQDVVLDRSASVVELTLEDPFGRALRGFDFKGDVTTSSWDPHGGYFAMLNRSGDRTLAAYNGRRWITALIPQNRLRPGQRSKLRFATGDPHEFIATV